MNNKAINEFGFPRIWRIKQISEGVILLDLLNSSYSTQPHSLIAERECPKGEDMVKLIFYL